MSGPFFLNSKVSKYLSITLLLFGSSEREHRYVFHSLRTLTSMRLPPEALEEVVVAHVSEDQLDREQRTGAIDVVQSISSTALIRTNAPDLGPGMSMARFLSHCCPSVATMSLSQWDAGRVHAEVGL